MFLQEYERAIIFRLGRTTKGGKAVGPGIFFIVPCMDNVSQIDQFLSFFLNHLMSQYSDHCM